MNCYPLSYFASISLHKNFHDPSTIPSERKVCVVVVVSKVNLVLALVQNHGLGFVFGLGPS